MRKVSKDISNRVLLQHMQGMKHSLESRIDRLGHRLGSVENGLGSLKTEVRSAHATYDLRFTRIEGALQKLYAKRLDMVEHIERLEKVVGIA